MDNWYSEIENKVLTYVKAYMKEEYPDIDVTSKAYDVYPTEFPALYLHELSPVETGQDLDNTTVNAVLSTIEIQVFTDGTETDCRKIMTDAISLMKKLRFNVVTFPDVLTNNNIAFAVARFRRVIGSGDALY